MINVKIRNLPNGPRRPYIICRVVKGELWYFMMFDDYGKAKLCLDSNTEAGFDNLVMLEEDNGTGTV